MSGGEPSSIKQSPRCAAREPVWSRRYGYRVKARFDLEVYGLILQPAVVYVEEISMYQALYRKWRPQNFDDVCGQEHITSILKYETEHSKFSHAYLFCGSRGTGKTTCAKILAKAVNCESPVNGSPCNQCDACQAIDAGTATDVLEMDAASNNGVDNIRDIRDEVVYMPSALKYRVYIVDEVHMLSGSAFNALLKTLEEPPAHVIFILATTELHKLPSTIISRCQRFDFRRISTQVLVDRLKVISLAEEIESEPEALRIIAKMAQGGMRDAISLFELCAGTQKKVTVKAVHETLGTGDRENMENAVRAIAAGNMDAIFATVDSVVRSSKDISVFWQDLINFYRDILVIKTTVAAESYLDLTENETERLKKIAGLFTKETLLYHCRLLDDALYAMQRAGSAKRTVAEMTLVKMCDLTLEASYDAILARLMRLENAVAVGAGFQRMVSSAPSVELPLTEKATEVPPVKETTVEKVSSPKSELKVLRGWNEIAEKAAAGDGAVLAFIKMAKAFTDADGKVYIRFPNEFARSMVEKQPYKDSIRAALRVTLQREITEADILFGILEGSEETLSSLDDLNIENTGE